MKTLLAIVTTLAVVLVGSTRAADVSGKWKSEFESPIGHLKYTFDLKAEGGKLTGKAIRELDGQKTETEIKEGKASSDEVAFVEVLKFNDQDVRIEYQGKLADDQIKFTRKVGDFATMQIAAQRETTGPDASGVWLAEFDTQIGQQKYVFTLKAEGEKLTGKANAEIADNKYETELKDGKLKADEISFLEPLKFQEVELRIEYKGKVAGDEMKLTRQIGDVATEQLVARRVKSPSGKPDSAAAKSLTLKVVKVDSEETVGENARGSNAVDGNPATIWHTEWESESLSGSHEIIIELSAPTRLKGFTYLPRQDGQENGSIQRYEFYVSDDGQDFGSSVAKGEFARGKELKSVTFEPKACRYVKLRARSEINGQAWTSAAEIGVIPE